MGGVEATEVPMGENLAPVIAAAERALTLENARADRLDTKARGQMTLTATWFGVVQAVAAVALTSRTPEHWSIAIAVAAALSALALVMAFVESANVWRLRTQPAITQETLEDMTLAARQRPETFSEDLVLQYRHLLGHAQQLNEQRAAALDSATMWWWSVMAFALTELVVAVLARIMDA